MLEIMCKSQRCGNLNHLNLISTIVYPFKVDMVVSSTLYYVAHSSFDMNFRSAIPMLTLVSASEELYFLLIM